jgi:HK97 family phage major capsid protein
MEKAREAKTLLEENAKLLKEYRDIQDKKNEKHDNRHIEQEKRREEVLTQLSEKSQKIDALETAMNRPGTEKMDDNKEVERKEIFTKFLRRGEKSLSEIEKKALSVGSDPDGGYTVSPDMSSAVVSRIFESSPIRQLASIETIGSDSLELLIDDDEAGAAWVGELGTRAETDTPEMGKKVIYAHELHASPRASQKLLDDSALDIERWLGAKVADKFGRTENTAFVSGDGSAKPRGFLTYPAWAVADTYERDAIEQIASGSAGAITADGLISLQNALKEQYQTGAAFLMKRASYGDVLKLKDQNDQYLLGFSLADGGRPVMSLLNHRVIFADDMPAVAADALAVAYGDFSVGYKIVDRVGIRMLRDPYSSKPYVVFYTTKRVGGDVVNFEAIKLQKLEA